MIVIICDKYIQKPSRTVDATERTRFSKSRPNDHDDIGQGQGSSLATHPPMLLIICTKYGKNPSWTVNATGRTRKVNGPTDMRTDRRTDRQTGWIQYIPAKFVARGITKEDYFTVGAYRRHCDSICQTDSMIFSQTVANLIGLFSSNVYFKRDIAPRNSPVHRHY